MGGFFIWLIGGFMFKHGFSYERLYTIWNSMVQRCTQPSNKQWKHYGERGILVCAEWLPPAETGYPRFKQDAKFMAERQGLTFADIGGLALTGRGYTRQGLSPPPKTQGDSGLGPNLKYTLDRSNNAEGYSLENCRWATYAEQSRNRRGGVCGREYRIGVCWVEGKGKFKAYGTENGRYIHLGYFTNEDDANAARLRWELQQPPILPPRNGSISTVTVGERATFPGTG